MSRTGVEGVLRAASHASLVLLILAGDNGVKGVMGVRAANGVVNSDEGVVNADDDVGSGDNWGLTDDFRAQITEIGFIIFC